jgi:putative zinc finger protein
MDHNQAVRLMATERYLLNEFTPELKEEFEEHFFGCPECALDVRMGAALIAHGPSLVNRPESGESVVTTTPTRPGWFGWLRPAIVLPAMAILLAVIGFQNFVVRPRMEDTIAHLNQPQVLASAYLSTGDTRGASRSVVTTREGTPFILFVDVPGESPSASFVAELYSPAGAKEWSLQISAETVEAAHGTLPIRVSLAHNQPGAYVLVLRKSGNSGGEGTEIGRYPFELQFR